MKKRTDAFAEETLIVGSSMIERAWHRSCEPNWAPPDSPFQAAVLTTKQAIERVRRMGPDAYADFSAIVRLALTEQRD